MVCRDDKDLVKIADVGITKRAMDITGTFCGTEPYMAPEILSGRRRYGHETDIYSLGIVMWEMWYGMGVHLLRVYSRYARDPAGFAEKVDDGSLRPDIQQEHTGPIEWTNLLQRCWDSDPEQRPGTAECEKVIQAMN